MVAQEQRKWEEAEGYYQQALQIFIEYKDRYAQASTYHQLGTIALKQRDFVAAQQWYLKSLAIKEKQGDEHGAALTYGNLGVLAG